MDRLKPLFKFLGVILYYCRYKHSQYWDSEKITNYQFKRLKKQLKLAYETKFYKALFDQCNFHPERDFNSLYDLKKIPITKKTDVKKETESFIVERYKNVSLRFKTSGSTGKPMEAFIHPYHWIVEQSVVFRHWIWGGYRIGDITGMIRSYAPREGEGLIKFSPLINTYYYSPFHLTPSNMLSYYKHMKSKNINVIRGYPSSVKIFAEFINNEKLYDLKIKLILCASEVLSENDRNFIEGVFKAPISNHYGLAEQIVMFGDCEEHKGLHNYFEYGYVELIDTSIPNVKKIIGTNLHNKSMPLIRYDTEDLALIGENLCTCGRKSVTIKNIIGRKDQNILCPAGFEIPSVNFYTMMEYYQEIFQWQIVYDQKLFTLIIDSKKSISPDKIQKILNDLEIRLNNSQFKIEIKESNEFIKRGEGKIPVILKI